MAISTNERATSSSPYESLRRIARPITDPRATRNTASTSAAAS